MTFPTKPNQQQNLQVIEDAATRKISLKRYQKYVGSTKAKNFATLRPNHLAPKQKYFKAATSPVINPSETFERSGKIAFKCNGMVSSLIRSGINQCPGRGSSVGRASVKGPSEAT